jgi:hypothetical protein
MIGLRKSIVRYLKVRSARMRGKVGGFVVSLYPTEHWTVDMFRSSPVKLNETLVPCTPVE